jgi:hypothetical protein
MPYKSVTNARAGHWEVQDSDGKVIAVCDDPDISATIATAMATGQAREILKFQRLAGEMGWRDMRMSLALRLLRVYALNPIELPESGAVKAYLAAWIDDGNMGPIAWPHQLPGLAAQLRALGYEDAGGLVGLVLPGDRKPETVQ